MCTFHWCRVKFKIIYVRLWISWTVHSQGVLAILGLGIDNVLIAVDFPDKGFFPTMMFMTEMWRTWFLDYIVWVWDPMLGLINDVRAPWWPFPAAKDISEFESAAIIVWQICAAIQVTCLFAKQLRCINTSPRYMHNVFTLLTQLEITDFTDFNYKQSIVSNYTCWSRNRKIGRMEYCIIHTTYYHVADQFPLTRAWHQWLSQHPQFSLSLCQQSLASPTLLSVWVVAKIQKAGLPGLMINTCNISCTLIGDDFCEGFVRCEASWRGRMVRTVCCGGGFAEP